MEFFPLGALQQRPNQMHANNSKTAKKPLTGSRGHSFQTRLHRAVLYRNAIDRFNQLATD